MDNDKSITALENRQGKKVKTVAFITTRMKSTRLPGKALSMIGDKNVTQHMVDRLRKVKEIDDVVVVPSEDSQEIVDYCHKNNISVVEHHKDFDYLGQLMAGVLAFQPDYIVRAWGDCPFLCPAIVQRTLQLAKQKNLYIVPICQNGLNVYAYPVGIFHKMVRDMSQHDKWYFNYWDEAAWVKTNNLLYQYDAKTSGVKLSIDTDADLKFLRGYYDKRTNRS